MAVSRLFGASDILRPLNQVASLWAAMPKSIEHHTKIGFRAKLKSWKTDHFAKQNQLLRPDSDPALLNPPRVLFLAPTEVAQPLELCILNPPKQKWEGTWNYMTTLWGNA